MSEGRKDDQAKARVDLIPPAALEAAGLVFAHGAEKYGERNWEAGIDVSRLYAAVLRHVLAWFGGEDNDPDSGLPHLDHALCSMLMLNETMRRMAAKHDDRPLRPKRYGLEIREYAPSPSVMRVVEKAIESVKDRVEGTPPA